MIVKIKDSNQNEPEIELFLKNRGSGFTGVLICGKFNDKEYTLGWIDTDGFHSNNGLPRELGNMVKLDYAGMECRLKCL